MYGSGNGGWIHARLTYKLHTCESEIIYFILYLFSCCCCCCCCCRWLLCGHVQRALKKASLFFTVVGLELGVVVGWMDGWLVVGWVGIHFIQFFCTFHTLLPSSLVKKNNIKYNTHFFIFFVASSRLSLWYGFLYMFIYLLFASLGSWLFFLLYAPSILGGICVFFFC